MPSTYTTSLRLTLPANGELAGTWGTTVNAGVTSLAEAAIAGTAAVTMIDADYTLTAVNGSADQARNMFVTLTGTLSAARNVICPPVSKLYFVTNNTTGGYAITFKTLAGTGISVPNGQRAVVYCNGTDVLGGLTALDSLSLNGSLTLVGGTANGVLYLNGSKAVTSGSALTFDGTNLGIGVTSPSQKLDILGGIAVRAATSGANQDIIALRALNSDNTAYANAIYYANSHRWAYAGATEGMRLDSSGNLGIGTASPGYRLTVAGTAGAAVLNLLETGVRSWAIRAGGAATNTFDISDLTAGQTRLTLDSSGNLGLGVAPPPNTTYPSLFLQNNVGLLPYNGDGWLVYNAYTTGANQLKYRQSGLAATAYEFDQFGAHTWHTAPSGTAGNALTFTRVMTLDASGNLGLGVTPVGHLPSAYGGPAFQIGARSTVLGSTNLTELALNTYYATGFWRYIGTGIASSYRQDNGAHAWYTAPSGTAGNPISFTQAMTLDASGNLGIGTASTGNYRLRVDATNRSLYVTTAGATAALPSVYLSDSTHGVDIVLTPENGYGRFGTFTNSPLAFITNNTERMRLDASGNLGIGTNAPSTRLQAYDATSATIRATSGVSANLDLTANATDVRVGTPNGVPLLFLTGNSERARIDSSGNLGLGVTPSAWLGAGYIDFPGNGYVGNAASYSGNTLSTGLNAYYGTGNWRYKQSSLAASRFDHTNGAFAWLTAPSGTAGNAITFTQAMTLDASGNLGLGVTPTYKLDVYGTGSQTVAVRAATSGDARFYAECAGTNSGWMQYTRSLQALQWSANGATQHMTLDSSGNLGIGTSSPIAATGTTVDVAGASGASQRWRNNAGTSSAYLEVAAGATNFGNVSSTPITFVTAATERMRLDNSGNLGIGTASPASKLHVSSGAIRLSDGYELGWGDNSAYIAGNGTTELLQFFTASSERMRIDSTGNLGIGTTSPVNKLDIVGSFGRGAPVTKTADFTLAATENWVICNKSGSNCVVTLPAASSWTGREVTFVNRQASSFGVVSASSNVVPRSGGAPSTAIAGVGTGSTWSTLVSDGTNWIIMASS